MSEPASFLGGRVSLFNGDCLALLPTLAENSFDSCVCDPPYHLSSIVKRFGADGAAKAQFGKDGAFARSSAGFMGRKWDGGDIAFRPDTWAAVLRILKPGAYIVAFSSSRTFGRMSVAIEDAGFITHPLIGWVFAQGFPKAHRVDAPGWEGWRYGGQAMKPALEPIYVGQKPFSEKTGTANVLRWGTGAINIDGCRIESSGEHKRAFIAPREDRVIYGDRPRLREGFWPTNAAGRWPANIVHDGSPEVLATFPDSDGQQGKTSGREPSDAAGQNGIYGRMARTEGGDPRNDSGSAARFFASFPQEEEITTDEVTVEWISEQGRCQARLPVDTGQLPLKGIVVSGSALSKEWNTFLSGSNIAALCRTASNCIIETETNSTTMYPIWNWLTHLLIRESIAAVKCEAKHGGSRAASADQFFPSLTIILGETVSLPGASSALCRTPLRISASARPLGQQFNSAKRFHYSGKADADSRLGSAHPTIKPVALMRWLCRLVTPPCVVSWECVDCGHENLSGVQEEISANPDGAGNLLHPVPAEKGRPLQEICADPVFELRDNASPVQAEILLRPMSSGLAQDEGDCLPAMRNDVQTARGSEILLGGMRTSVAPDQTNPLLDMSDDVPTGASGSPVLQPPVRSEGEGSDSRYYEGGLSSALGSRQPDGGEVRLCDGASDHRIPEDGAAVRAFGGRPSRERHKDGQPTGESSGNGAGSPQSHQEGSPAASGMSTLQGHHSAGMCQACGKPLQRIERRGVVLDPFAGSGTTGEAAYYEGFQATLIERETEYCADIARRMALCLAGPDERKRESIKARGKTDEAGPLFASAAE